MMPGLHTAFVRRNALRVRLRGCNLNAQCLTPVTNWYQFMLVNVGSLSRAQRVDSLENRTRDLSV